MIILILGGMPSEVLRRGHVGADKILLSAFQKHTHEYEGMPPNPKNDLEKYFYCIPISPPKKSGNAIAPTK